MLQRRQIGARANRRAGGRLASPPFLPAASRRCRGGCGRARCPDQLPQRLLHGSGNTAPSRVASATGTLLRTVVSSLELWRIAGNAPIRSGRGRRDRRHIKFYEPRDNLTGSTSSITGSWSRSCTLQSRRPHQGHLRTTKGTCPGAHHAQLRGRGAGRRDRRAKPTTDAFALRAPAPRRWPRLSREGGAVER